MAYPTKPSNPYEVIEKGGKQPPNPPPAPTSQAAPPPPPPAPNRETGRTTEGD